MTAAEKDKSRQVLALFAEYLAEKKDIYVAELDEVGFVLLHDLREDFFERNVVCPDAKALFEALQDLWEADYLFVTGLENGCEDFDSSEESLTDRQREAREEIRKVRRQKLAEILK